MFDLKEVENSFDNMPNHEPFICSFSGGKDSAIALSMACEKGDVKGILNWVDSDKNSSVFHFQNVSVIERQAECLDIPLTITHFTPWKHRLALVNTYKELANQGIKSIVFGDIYWEDGVKIQSILCNMAGLTPRFPLWKKDYGFLLKEMQTRKIQSIITRVNTVSLDESWLGKTFDQDAYETFCALGIDPFGEKGEFHTTVIDADVFKKPLRVNFFASEEMNRDVDIKFSSHNDIDSIYRLFK